MFVVSFSTKTERERWRTIILCLAKYELGRVQTFGFHYIVGEGDDKAKKSKERRRDGLFIQERSAISFCSKKKSCQERNAC